MEELKVVARWHTALHYTWHTWRGEKRAGGNTSLHSTVCTANCHRNTTSATTSGCAVLWFLAPGTSCRPPRSIFQWYKVGPQRRKYNKTNNNQFRYTQGLFVAGKYRGKSKNQMDSVIWLRAFGE